VVKGFDGEEEGDVDAAAALPQFIAAAASEACIAAAGRGV
jgi:hypothetical protein